MKTERATPQMYRGPARVVVRPGSRGVAAAAGRALAEVADGTLARLPVTLRFWDGSELSSADGAPVVVLRDPAALAHVLRASGQVGLARERAAQAGVQDRVEIRVQDYREVADGPYDKIASVGMYEHVGRVQLGRYASVVIRLLRPGGLFLNHGITRLVPHPPEADPFIARYVFPDGEPHPVTDMLRAMQAAGLEIRDLESLREHYALTLRRWVANLAAHRDEAVAEAGTQRERVWRLYMVGSALGFEAGEISVHQALAARPGAPYRLPLNREKLLS